MDKIITISNKTEEKFLRRKTVDFDFSRHTRKQADELVKTMRRKMKEAEGVGLAANQIGLDMRVFVAQVPDRNADGKPINLSSVERKFYAIFNPEIMKISKEKSAADEGCLSVGAGIYGKVERPERVTIVGFDKNGRKIKVEARKLLARIFQHEIDHLNGTLFIDKAKELKKAGAENRKNQI